MSNVSANIVKASTGTRKFSNELKEQGMMMKRTDAFHVSLDAIHFTPENNIRELDYEHVAKIAEAIKGGEYVDPLELERIYIEDKPAFSVVDGHHTFAALQSLKVESFDAVIFTGSETDKVVRMYNAQLGKKLSPIEKARAFQRLVNEGLTNKEISNRTGERPSTISNSIILLRGDDEMISLIDKGEISGTVAKDLIREHGDNATKYARLHIELSNSKKEKNATESIQVITKETTNNPTVESANDSTEQPTKIAAKKSDKSALKPRELSAKKVKNCIAMVKFMATKVDGDSITDLPKASIELLLKMAQDIEDVEEYNAKLAEELSKAV